MALPTCLLLYSLRTAYQMTGVTVGPLELLIRTMSTRTMTGEREIVRELQSLQCTSSRYLRKRLFSSGTNRVQVSSGSFRSCRGTPNAIPKLFWSRSSNAFTGAVRCSRWINTNPGIVALWEPAVTYYQTIDANRMWEWPIDVAQSLGFLRGSD